jgi:abhydrolase domain-containing protein 6
MRAWAKFFFCIFSILGALAFTTYQALPGLLEQYYLTKAFNESGIKIKSVNIGRDRVVYGETEKGKPTLLLVHGFQGDKRSWIPYIKKLNKQFHIVALDLPGHGGTDVPRSLKYDLESQAQFLEVFVRKLGLDTFHLMGISMGGGISTLYASKYGYRVNKLVLINPFGADTPYKSGIELEVEKGNNYFFPENIDDLDTFMVYIKGKPLALARMFKQHLLMKLKEKQAFYKKVFYQLISSKKIEAFLPNIHSETLVLVGENDQILHPSSIESYKKYVPNVKTLVFKDGEHVFYGKILENVINILKDFLADPTDK